MQKRRCKGSLTKDIRWECIHTVINIRNCTNQWTVLHRILPGSGTPSIRPPEWRVSVTGGSSNTISEIDMHDFIDYLDSQGVEYYDWNVSSGDGGSMKLSTDTLLENCTKDIDTRDTSIILLHDSAEKPTTVEALPDIIENILARPDTVILPITENTRPIHHIE